jgi:hypothetical protein
VRLRLLDVDAARLVPWWAGRGPVLGRRHIWSDWSGQTNWLVGATRQKGELFPQLVMLHESGAPPSPQSPCLGRRALVLACWVDYMMR